MPYRLLPDVALADVAFEASSATVNGLFRLCGRALSDIMVDSRTLRPKVVRRIRVEGEDLDRLLYDFLTELIVLKDVDSLLFKEFQIEIRNGRILQSTVRGEKIDRKRHALRNDVKAVTMHMFGVRREGKSWKAIVVLDI